MTAIVEESVCWDCKGKSTCQRLKRLSPGKTIREEIEKLYDKAKSGEIDTSTLLHKIDGEYRKRNKEIFEIIIVNCSMKVQYSERERLANEAIMNPEEHSDIRYLFYCSICKRMHISGSGIGKEHKEIIDKQNKEINKDGKNFETKRQSEDAA